MGWDITSSDNLYTSNLSYNFSRYKNYWNINTHLHGKNTTIVIVNLYNCILTLANEGIKPVIYDGQDGWTPEKNVFMYHMKRLLHEISNTIKNNPEHLNAIYQVDDKEIPEIDINGVEHNDIFKYFDWLHEDEEFLKQYFLNMFTYAINTDN